MFGRTKCIRTALQAARFSTTKMEVTPATLRQSADRMLDYYVNLQQPDGRLEGFSDSAHYCKLPNALVWGGRIPEADRMLDYCVKTFFRSNGDFTNIGEEFSPTNKTLHWEFADFYAYLNQWWITAGMRLGRFDFVPKAYDYVHHQWYNPKTCAGILQEPINMRYENCIFTSAHIGLTNLYMGQMDVATSIGDTIVKMVDKQPGLDFSTGEPRFYMRFDDDFNLLKGFAPDDKGVKLAAIMKAENPNQCWWSLGYPAAYLAILYRSTGQEKYLEGAKKILDFAANPNCGNLRECIFSHKVMWAASLVGEITGRADYWDLCRDIAGHIINEGQVEDGRVLNWGWERGTEYGQAQIIDQTAEIAYWFYVVARQMEKSSLAGTLK